MLLDVYISNPKKVVFNGKARNIIMPGEKGVFEVLPFHKRFLSLLVSGTLFIEDKEIDIKRGIAKVNQNKVTVIIEEDES